MNEYQNQNSSGNDAATQVTPQVTPVLTPSSPETPPEPAAGNVVERLLKAPRSVAFAILNGKNLAAESKKMLLTAAVCYAVFGFALGLFNGWGVALMDVLKAPFIVIASMLLCFPSLFVFTAVSGSPMTLGRAFALCSACLAMTGLIVVGLAPVAWLFAVSTESLPFVIVMALVIWFVALPFAMRFLRHAQGVGLLNRTAGLRLWFFVFIIVTLQMTTVMRPILTAPNFTFDAPKKMFFIKHFIESL